MEDHWANLMPSMISYCSRSGRVEDFEKFIIQDPKMASDYAYRVLKDKWPEAEDIIASCPESSTQYAKNVIRNRWEKGEDAIATDHYQSFQYAKYVLRGRFQKGESAIAKDGSFSFNYAKDILRGRFIEGEPAIAAFETEGRNEVFVKNYYEMVVKTPSDWASWTEDQLKHSPCWMYMYAKEFLNGRLPDFLHNTMNILAMTIPNNYYVKRYFKAKKYNKKIKRRKKPEIIVSPIESKESTI